ncbi:LysR substrate-binding domain-containing protein [uncultured Caballeronia sp.]|uniref:LysR family transcriptional regulator n=1 Tax=uncultured Caballeronia sp. TaxID=1827198 RepID=UPI0015771D3B
MDSVSAFNVFVQVAETRSFVAAGRLLGVSASAVGKRVSALEERLGVRLFHRSTRSVTLTSEGALFLERSRRILAEIEAAQAELSQVNVAPRGRLRVSLPLVTEPFLHVIAGFKLAYPAVDLDLDFTDRQVDIIEEGFDAVIRTGDVLDSRLTSRRMGAYHMLLVGSPAYFEAHGKPLSENDLMQHTCIQFRYPNTGKLEVWPLQRDEVQTDFQLPPSIVCNNLEARICFALQGVGIAYLPDFAIHEHLASGRLVDVLDDCAQSGGTFRIMWPSGKHVAPKLRVFIDFICERCFPPAAPTLHSAC